MILFIVIAAFFLFMTLSDDDGLICKIKFDVAGEHPIYNIFKDVWKWFWLNIGLNIVNLFAVFSVSIVVFFVLAFICPQETSYWEFNINSLQDNLVTEGTFRGGIFGVRGHVDGELSYFYSRTLSIGEKIEHIPANKTYVRYSDNEHPHIEVHQRRIGIPKWLYKVFFIEFMNNNQTDYYVIVVPDGTISVTGQYNIDLQ